MDPEHISLVRTIAFQMVKTLPANVEVDDLLQVGMIGLLEALARFDGAAGVQFNTFATPRIRGAMLDQLRSADYLSRDTRRVQRRLAAAVRTLEQSLGRPPMEGELASELGMSMEDLRSATFVAAGVTEVMIEDLGSSGDFLEREEIDEETPVTLLMDARRREALVLAIGGLPEREQYIMSMYYEHEMNLREIGAVLGVTESRVSQIHAVAIGRLQRMLREH